MLILTRQGYKIMKRYKEKENKEIKSEQEIRTELLEIQQACDEFDDYDVWDFIEEYYEELV